MAKTAQKTPAPTKGDKKIVAPQKNLEAKKAVVAVKETKETYRQRIMDTVCELIARGHTLSRICEAVEIVPDASNLYDWMDQNPELHHQYACARARQADFYADEIITIADNEPDPQVARVRMDARKWHASKTAPKKYGERTEQVISGDITYKKIEIQVVEPRRR